MIFASVGSMLPFDRLVRAVDDWAGTHLDIPVFIQIGGGTYQPRHAEWAPMLTHGDYRRHLEKCRLFIAHVGMGSILQGLEARRQMLLMPRHPERGEHTTDHQRHSAARFAETPGIRIVDDVHTLMGSIDALLDGPATAIDPIPPYASSGLIEGVTAFLAPVRER